MRKVLATAVAGATVAAGVFSVAGTASAATVARPFRAPTSLSVHVSTFGVRGHQRDTITGTLARGREGLGGEVVALDIVNGIAL